MADRRANPGEQCKIDNGAPPLKPRSANSFLPFDVSVVIPTKNEASNIVSLVTALNALPVGCLACIIFVDDSDDGTCDQIQATREWSALPIVLIHRPPEQRRGGLGSAVLRGIGRSHSSWICVMDGDLQHPPSVIPRLVRCASSAGVDIVVGSRFSDGGQIAGLNRMRQGASRSLTWLTRRLFPHRLGNVSDPLSGFFVIKRARLHPERLQPGGYKILLEVLIKHPELVVSEAGFTFESRENGESKAHVMEVWRFVKLLGRLRAGDNGRRFLRFAAVGATGFVVNLGLAALLVYAFDASYLLAAILATQGSTLWNFFGYDRWVFPDREEYRKEPESLAKTYLVNNGAFVMRGPTIFLLTAVFQIHYLPAIFFSLVMFTMFRFTIANSWIWPSSRRGGGLRREGIGD